MNPVIAIEKLGFSYGPERVLEDISLQVPEGDFLGIIGPNGGGKSTLLKLILGLLKAERGSISVLGTSPLKARTHIGYVPQHMHQNLNFPIAALDVVLMGRLSPKRMGRPFTRQDREIALACLEQVEMAQYARRPIAQLSGGERQRIIIARALCTRPKILLLDEPTASIDPHFSQDLFAILERLRAQMTIIMVTHDIGIISRHVRTIACLNRRLICHQDSQLTEEMLAQTYQCPVDLIAHGLPHRVLPTHGAES